jgi:two-component system, OmpR family, response regulator
MERRAVLLVDDEPAYGAIVRALVGAAGLEVVCAADALEGLQAIRAKQFSLVLMDIQMAGISGLRGATILRQSADWARRVPVIAFTAERPPTGERFFLERDFDGWLSKPFDAQDLFDVLRRWLGQSSLEMPRTERSMRLETLVGRDQAQAMVRRVEARLAQAIATVDAGGDPRPLAHNLGGLMGTIGLAPLAAAWLALLERHQDIWPTVRQLSVEWLNRRTERSSPVGDGDPSIADKRNAGV